MGFFGKLLGFLGGASCSNCNRIWNALEIPEHEPTSDEILDKLSYPQIELGFVCTDCRFLLCESCYLRAFKKCPTCGSESFRTAWLLKG